MEIEFNFQITPVRELIQKVETKINEVFKEKTAILREQTLMVIVELLDNAVKYGMSVPGIGGMNLNVAVTDKEVEISVSNTVDVKQHIDYVTSIINEIKESNNAEALYANRLKQLMNERKPGESRLGFYRIAYEGEFELSYTYEKNVLTVIASKRLK
jgi:hypothetical protein